MSMLTYRWVSVSRTMKSNLVRICARRCVWWSPVRQPPHAVRSRSIALWTRRPSRLSRSPREDSLGPAGYATECTANKDLFTRAQINRAICETLSSFIDCITHTGIYSRKKLYQKRNVNVKS